jgi:hypothetical protein
VNATRAIAAAGCLLLLAWAPAACTLSVSEDGGAGGSPGPVSTSPASTATDGGVDALPTACQARGSLPDPACTPGATDPAVTQANVGTTICLSGYSARVRPPVSYTDPLKRRLMARYGSTGSAAGYELDHLVPLEVGGAPRSVRNLWPESRSARPGASEKDGLENLVRAQVCAGRITLAAGQRMFEADWVQAWEQAGRPRG